MVYEQYFYQISEIWYHFSSPTVLLHLKMLSPDHSSADQLLH